MTQSDPEAVLTDQMSALQTFGTALNGAGAEAQSAHRSVLAQVGFMHNTTQAAAAQIAAMAARDDLPREHRARVITETREKAEAQLAIQKQAATISAHILRAALTAQIVPRPAANPVDRQLARQTVMLHLDQVPNDGRVEALRSLLGRSPVVDAEMMSEDFGRRLIGDQHWEPFLVIGRETLLQHGGHDARAQAAAKALVAMRGEANVVGRIGGVASLAALRIKQ